MQCDLKIVRSLVAQDECAGQQMIDRSGKKPLRACEHHAAVLASVNPFAGYRFVVEKKEKAK
jgi:hypothetical protein